LYKFREALQITIHLVAKEVRTQFAGSILGRLWWVFGPFLQMGLYALVFGLILKSRPLVGGIEVPYVVYLCAGLLPWTVWSSFLARAPQLFIDNAHYIKKIRIPKFVFVVQSSAVAALPFLVTLPLFLGLAVILGAVPTFMGVLGYTVVTLTGLLLCMGIVMLLAYLNVFLRDVGQLVPFLVQVLFWSLPICYAQQNIAGGLKEVLQLNPFSGLVNLAHAAFIKGTLSSREDLLHVVAMISLSWLVGLFVAHRTDKWVVDEL
jgi:lipopolysaccharide transport system permease protein